ncbi:hypothetical protein ACIQUB_30815 [Rhizobium sp. NPDC090275]|uniref:hypothetical protein n=1 Tax=Rhizobium sp. NPDC090275 TaxID=3364498 RepID=UPI00383BCCC5
MSESRTMWALLNSHFPEMPMTIGHPGAPNSIRLGELVQYLGKAIADLPHTGIVLFQSDFTGKR